MFASTLLLPLVLAASALAFPTMKRDTTPGCNSSFPLNGVGYVKSFSLLAQFDSNGTQTALSLGSGGSAATDDSLTYLSTSESIGTQVVQTFTMENSGIIAHPINSRDPTRVSQKVFYNGLLSFVPQSSAATPAPAETYCEVVNMGAGGSSYKFPVFAAAGDSENFQLCKDSTSEQVLVVYNPDEKNANDYVFSTCEKVHILLAQ